jgi:hypothetical protein
MFILDKNECIFFKDINLISLGSDEVKIKEDKVIIVVGFYDKLYYN